SRPSLYQRSARTWFFAYSFANIDRSRPSSSVTRSFSGVDPPEPSSPTSFISRIVNPSCSCIARRIASPRRPPTSRCADLPRCPYRTGKPSLGVKARNSATGIATLSRKRGVGEADLLQVAEDGVDEGRVRTDGPPNRVTDSDDAQCDAA